MVITSDTVFDKTMASGQVTVKKEELDESVGDASAEHTQKFAIGTRVRKVRLALRCAFDRRCDCFAATLLTVSSLTVL
jgi:hypothetical protein